MEAAQIARLTKEVAYVVLNGNYDHANVITVAKDQTLVIDLNGYTLSGIDETAKNYGLIQNNGNLTVTGEGIIVARATINSGWNRYSAVISNNPGANLTVEGGAVIEHLGGTDMAYGIDILTNGGIGDVLWRAAGNLAVGRLPAGSGGHCADELPSR